MREIKFRGKPIGKNGWVKGGFHKHLNRTPSPIGDSIRPKDIDYLIIESGFSDWNMPKPLVAQYVEPETVGQYTGLKDKNEVDIYEGDIIQNKSDDGDIIMFVIDWIDQEAGFFARYIDKKHGENLLNLGDYWIIGNIYDNPELLEQQHD